MPLRHRRPPLLAVATVSNRGAHLRGGHRLARLDARAAVEVAVRGHDLLGGQPRGGLEAVNVLSEAAAEQPASVQLGDEMVGWPVRGRRESSGEG